MSSSSPSFRRSLLLIGAAHLLAIGGLLFFAQCSQTKPPAKDEITWLDPAAAAGAPALPGGARPDQRTAEEAALIIAPGTAPKPAPGARATPTPRGGDPESDLASATPVPTIAATATPRPTRTPTPTPRPTRTPTPTPHTTAAPTLVPTPTRLPTPTAAPTPKPKVTPPRPTAKPTPKPTKKPVPKPEEDDEEDEPAPTAKPKATASPKASVAPKPSSTPRPKPSAPPALRPPERDGAPEVREPRSLEGSGEPGPTVKKATRPDAGGGDGDETPVRPAQRPGEGGANGPGGKATEGRGTSTTATAAGGNKGADVGWYHSMIHDRFYSQWNQPTSISTSENKYRAKLKLRIQRDGSIASYSISRSSGNELMDQSVLDAASRVKRIEPLPESLAKSGAYDVSIDFEMD